MSLADWKACNRILCIRADNMGDLLMSSPAIDFLKKGLNCQITVLTSVQAALLVPFLPGIDHVITASLPWVRTDQPIDGKTLTKLAEKIRLLQFDACVIFTVYSQSAIPAAMLVKLAGITRVLGYCRENPYTLISDWVPDPEPYFFIHHQVDRDLDLVRSIGLPKEDCKLILVREHFDWSSTKQKLREAGVTVASKWLIFHIGVSEAKRKFNPETWVLVARTIVLAGYQILVTGGLEDQKTSEDICAQIGPSAFSLCGKFNLAEFISLIDKAKLLVSVNTVAIHIAAALDIPQVVLYAQTNPQHLPWHARGQVVPFPVNPEQASRNEVLRYVNDHYFSPPCPYPSPELVADTILSVLRQPDSHRFPLVLNPEEIERKLISSEL